MNTYNVMVNYEGEGSTNIYIPGLGDTTITYGRPLYLRNASFNVIEALRQFRMMQVDIQINAKQEGAFRIVDLSNTTMHNVMQNRPVEQKKEVIDNNDISTVLSSGSNGPIPTLEPIKSNDTDFGSYKLPSGTYEGMTLSEVDKAGKLKSVYNGFKSRNAEVKEAIENYYKTQIK